MNPFTIWSSMERSDRYTLASSVVVPLLLWWAFIGRHKYSTRGMK